jgi:hypothetical protein
LFRSVSNRIVWKIFGAMVVGSAVFTVGAASAAQLTLDWMDNAGGTATFNIERKTGTDGTYAWIATTGTGITTYADSAVGAGTAYCYRVKASNTAGDSGYSNEACGSPAAGFDFTVAKAGTGSGTVVSSPPGINCGGNCVTSYPAGKVITLTATAASGSFFSGWSGGGCAGTDPCVMAGNTAVTVTATFSLGTAPTASVTTSTVEIVSSPAITLAYNGKVRDRVGQGDTALGPDGALDAALTVTLSGSGGRTVTGLRLDSNWVSWPGTWRSSSPGTGNWVLAAAPTLDGALRSAPGTMAVNFPVADGGSFVVFAADYLGGEFLPGNTLTVTATFSDGSTATASTIVPGTATLAVAYNGKVRDRVGQGETALAPDGALDAALTVTLSGSGGRTVTGLQLNSNWASWPGTWRTSSSGTGNWVLAAAATLDGLLLNAPGTMAVNFPVADGGNFVVFAADYLEGEFLPGNVLTVTATFSDGSTATAVTTVPAKLTLTYNGMLRDRVGQGETALGPDGTPDGTLTVTLSASGGRTVTALRLEGDYAPAPGLWLTNSPGTTHYVLGVAPALDGALLNAPGTMAVNFAVPDGGSFVLFAADWQSTGFQSGRTLTLTATFADGSTVTAVTTVP